MYESPQLHLLMSIGYIGAAVGTQDEGIVQRIKDMASDYIQVCGTSGFFLIASSFSSYSSYAPS